MTKSRTIAGIVLSCLCGATLWPLSSEYQLFLTDRAIVLPPYYGIELKKGVTGLTQVELRFDAGRVKSHNIVSCKFISAGDFATKDHELSESLGKRIASELTHWRSYIVSPFSTTVAFELRLDSKLPVNVRNYSIEYGKGGVPTKVILTGPVVTSPR
jgi:hypothetical protein